MIDLNLLRENFDYVCKAIKKKDPLFSIDKLAKLDKELRLIKQDVEALRHQKNELARSARAGVTDAVREQSKNISEQLKTKEQDLIRLEKEFNELYLMCPNLAADDVPVGNKDQNVVASIWGKKPEFSFLVKNHVELGDTTGWLDFQAAARMTGSHFALYKDDGVRLVYALALFMFNHNLKYGYSPVLPPYLVNEKALVGASNFPAHRENVYEIANDALFLTPTAEVNLSNIYRDHIFDLQTLPVRMTSWTSCFRREAGGYGATERGLIRIHQFEKVELYALCAPENAQEEHERMLDCAQEILKKLGLHYRVSLLAGQDCSFASAKTYDIEVWMPGQKEYKEVSSISNCTDFQARRCAIRYKKNVNDKTNFVYTLNGSSLALPRVMAALMETYQHENGTIALPEAIKNVTLLLT